MVDVPAQVWWMCQAKYGGCARPSMVPNYSNIFIYDYDYYAQSFNERQLHKEKLLEEKIHSRAVVTRSSFCKPVYV